MADPRAAVGAGGEAIVAADYAADGYAIRARNWSCRVGELDLVVARGPVLVFVEVRTVTTAFLRDPTVTVSAAKQARVGRAADAYLRSTGGDWRDVRFDVVGVVGTGAEAQIHRIENAFVPRWAF